MLLSLARQAPPFPGTYENLLFSFFTARSYEQGEGLKGWDQHRAQPRENPREYSEHIWSRGF